MVIPFGRFLFHKKKNYYLADFLIQATMDFYYLADSVWAALSLILPGILCGGLFLFEIYFCFNIINHKTVDYKFGPNLLK